jgi:bacillithiol system protein YtxJ
MNWIPITDASQISSIIEKSKNNPQLIFKHSVRCGTSALAKNRLEKGTAPEGIDFYYLDLINYRSISNQVADVFQVEHESPQVLLIRNGKCVYNESHIAIRMDEITEQVA